MNINDFLQYKHIVIQCHDIPDADAIGSGFALQQWLKSKGVSAKLVYGGRVEISKPSLAIMLLLLKIEIEKVSELPADTDLLITIDCQYGAGNVQKFDTPRFAVIDHHRSEIPEGDNVLIRPNLASCATAVYDLLLAEHFDVEHNYAVCNALYYGLFTDTNGLAEMRHPLDRDLADIACDTALIRQMKNSAITLSELDIVSAALKNYELIGNIGLFKAEPCDPNLLGFTSDIAQQAQQVDCCVVYCVLPFGIKLSIRCCSREIMASEIAAFLAKDVGSGGGNVEKAGGFIGFKDLTAKYGDIAPEAFLNRKINEYLVNFDLIYADNNNVDFASMQLYRKLPNPVGFAKTTDIFPDKSRITVRTLEGDIDTIAGDGLYLMIGVYGEVYPILREKFEKSYIVSEDKYEAKTEYFPTVVDRVTGEKHSLEPYARTCVPHGKKIVRASELTKDTKVFSYWDKEKYFFGSKGDFLAANEGDYSDCYIIRHGIFEETYEAIHAGEE